MSAVRLRKNQDRRVRAGHPWIFSNEIESSDGTFEDGDIVEILDARGAYLGRGYVNRHSLISVRVLTRGREEIDREFFKKRIQRALAYREGLYPGDDALRAVSSEGDLLPGLVVDRYAGVLAVGVLTLGIEKRREEIREVLEEIFSPRAVVLRADSPVRELESLPLEKRLWSGVADAAHPVTTVGGLRYRVDPLEGQKTGLFLDQRDNRRRLAGRVKEARVLDAFSHTGAWGIAALGHGASEAWFLDSSRAALDQADENLGLNGMTSKGRLMQGDAFALLPELGRARERFDVVIVDPPALVKKKSQLAQGLRAYYELNKRAMQLVSDHGWLFTSSCSHAVGIEEFRTALTHAARDAHRPFRLVEWGGQSLDHPVLLAAPETAYLKCAVLRAV